MQKRLECIVTGHVQLVMFRDFVTRNARRLGTVGSVKNMPDGSVSIIAEGEDKKLNELLTLVHRGPVLARVKKVTEVWSEPLGGYKNFDILYE